MITAANMMALYSTDFGKFFNFIFISPLKGKLLRSITITGRNVNPIFVFWPAKKFPKPFKHK